MSKMKELKALTRKRRIKGYYRMRKAELIEALERTKNLPEGVLAVNEAQLYKWLDSLEGIPTVLKLEFNNLVIKKRRNDSTLCTHGVVKYFCKACKGSQICPHNRHKAFCVPCGGSQICKHNKRKGRCKEC